MLIPLSLEEPNPIKLYRLRQLFDYSRLFLQACQVFTERVQEEDVGEDIFKAVWWKVHVSVSWEIYLTLEETYVDAD